MSSAFVCALCLIVLHSAGGVIYHIKPYPASPCPEQSCLTLSQFEIQEKFNIIGDLNTTLVFLPGEHNLSTSINITNKDHYGISGRVNTQGEQTASIFCDLSRNIGISGTMSVSIVNMLFIGCGNTIIDGVDHFILENSTFQGSDNNETALVLKTVKNATIVRSHFLANSNHGKHSIRNSVSPNFATGGAIFASSSTVEIIESTFERNEADRGGAIYADNDTVIIINKSNATSNNALNGGSVLHLGTGCIAMVTASNFSHNKGSVIANCDSTPPVGYDILCQSQEEPENKKVPTFILVIKQSLFYNNIATQNTNGGVVAAYAANVTIEDSSFTSNKANNNGGAILIVNCYVTIINSAFINNSANSGGAIKSWALFSPSSFTTISNCAFQHNLANDGSVLSSIATNIHIDSCLFQNNSGSTKTYVVSLNNPGEPNEVILSDSMFRFHTGGILYLVGNEYLVDNCTFEFNNLGFGVIFMLYGNMTVRQSIFQSNYHETNIRAWYSDFKLLGNNTFRDNFVTVQSGGVIFISGGSMVTIGTLDVMNNTAKSNVVLIIDCTALFSGDIQFTGNKGSLYAYSSNITFMGNILFLNQQESNTNEFGFENRTLEVGGAITSIYSNVKFIGSVILAQNSGARGGALLIIESIVTFSPESTVHITNNTAMYNGGGISIYKSFLTILGNCTLDGNTAHMNGGGIYTVSSSITVASNAISPTHFLSLKNNAANRGGGVYFEANSQLSILKSTDVDINTRLDTYINVANNIAYHSGGGFFVADETSVGICNRTTRHDTVSLDSRCFLQNIDTFENSEVQTQTLFMSNNSAMISGSNMYGGLLDRCTRSTAARLMVTDLIQGGALATEDIENGLSVFKEISNVNDLDTLASDPVQVCFCTNNQPDCSNKHTIISTIKGGSFVIPMVAVDHVNHSITATIIGTIPSLTGDLGEGQQFQITSTTCTDLRFNVVSSATSEQLVLYAKGPCGDAQPSQAIAHIIFLPCECPIGFEPLSKVQDTRCECVCDSHISHTASSCNASTSFVKKTSNSWIDYTSTTNPPGFITHPYCPYDYCIPITSRSEVLINFNNGSEGTNAQCNYNRAGTLCGACRDKFSLSLSSSQCLQCPSYWPVLTVVILPFLLVDCSLLLYCLY